MVRKDLQEGSSAHVGRVNDAKRKHKKSERTAEPSSLPGVQKLKSLLRQTRRLLAREDLASNIRVETERRLKALEADLASAEASKKERAIAVRYHKVKFFERQKVVRKLSQTSKQLSNSEDGSKAHLESTLADLRVDLNYILHFPKGKKYIALFPPELREGAGRAAEEGDTSKTDAGREEVRSWIRDLMAKGELPSRPELHLGSQHRHDFTGKKKSAQAITVGRHTQNGTLSERAAKVAESTDDFFGDDEEEEDLGNSDNE